MSEIQQQPRSRYVRRTAFVLGWIATGALVFGTGLASGWVGASQKAGSADGHGHGHAAGGDAHAGHAHPQPPALSPQTLANLGVEVGELTATEFVRTRDIPGVVEARPGSLRPASALVAGLIEEVLVVEGQRIAAGAPIARMRRDAFPRPALVLTDAVLRPLNEEFHGALGSLRSASQALMIAREELARVRGVLSAHADTPPSKIEIDLRNEERRALRELENARQEAGRHGLTRAEITAIESGEGQEPDVPPAERVLARNGLWSAEAASVLAALPESVRARPFTVAVVAELVGSHALSPRLADVIQKRSELAAAFLDIAGLIQQGWSVESLVALADAGALQAVVTITSPRGASDWDVQSVQARAGERVEAGATIVECLDLSRVQIVISPAGPDLAAIGAALAARQTAWASPLIAGSGPQLADLRIQRFETSHDHAGGSTAVVLAENQLLSQSEPGDAVFRSWALRPGLRYLVRVPLDRLADRFVLPSTAVTTQGPDTVLLLEDGAGFRAVPVRVEHRDSRVVVVAKDGAVFPGDRVVVKGAYSVLLALQAASGRGVDPHAGCGHAH